MKQSSLLQKLAPMGVAALGAVATTAGSMLVAPSASAQNACEFQFPPLGGPNFIVPGDLDPCNEGFLVQEGDKIFNLDVESFNFGGTNAFGNGAAGLIEFEDFPLPPPNFLGDSFIADVIFTEEELDEQGNVVALEEGITNGIGEMRYSISITEDDFVFNQVSIDSSTTGTGTEVVKQVFDEEGGNLLGTLTSTDGSSSSLDLIDDYTSLFIIDTYNVGENAVLLDFDNAFNQREHDVIVPEPSAILGLLAIGGLGLGLKRKKQA